MVEYCSDHRRSPAGWTRAESPWDTQAVAHAFVSGKGAAARHAGKMEQML